MDIHLAAGLAHRAEAYHSMSALNVARAQIRRNANGADHARDGSAAAPCSVTSSLSGVNSTQAATAADTAHRPSKRDATGMASLEAERR